MATRQLKPTAYDRGAAVFKALGHPKRLRIVDFLRKHGGEATGTEVARHAGISLVLLSHHADALVHSGIVRRWKDGRTSHLELDREALESALYNLDG